MQFCSCDSSRNGVILRRMDGVETDGEKVLSCGIRRIIGGNTGNSGIDCWIHPIAMLLLAVIFDSVGE